MVRLTGKRKMRWAVIILCVVILMTVFLLMFENSIKPALLSMSEAKFRTLVTREMNNAVLNCASNVKYGDLISIERDQNGKVTMLQANTIAMSLLATRISNEAQKSIADMQMQGIQIPLGNIIGGQILAGLGPKITINIIPAGTVTAEFSSEFESSGINQTRHRILINLHATVSIVVPNASQKVEVTVQVPISETLIVGDVPQTYLFIDEREKMYNLVPD